LIAITTNVLTLPTATPDIGYTWRFKSDFTPSIAGSEARVIRWGEPRLELTFPELPLLEGEITSLRNFFNARGGKRDGFLFKVPDACILGTNRGRLLSISSNTFQIAIVYSVGTVRTIKPVRYPVPNTTKVFANGVEVTTGWTINVLTGQIQFATVPNGALTVSCEYYTPVRFDNDEIEALQVSGGSTDVFRAIPNPSRALLLLRERVGDLQPIYQVNGLRLKEAHRPLSNSFYTSADFAAVSADFQYPIIPENVRSNRYTTEITTGLSDVEDAVTRSTRTVTRYVAATLYNDELDYLLNYFFTAKGRAISFLSKRFDTDELTYTRIAPDAVTMGDLSVISCFDSNNRRYQVFGIYLSKYTSEIRFGFPWQNHPSCNTIRYWRTVSPITLLPNESTADIEVRRTVQPGIDGSRWTVAKRGQGLSTETDVYDLGQNDGVPGYQAYTEDDRRGAYDRKELNPENVIGGPFGIFINYRNKNLGCSGQNEIPSFPRGDDFVITDIVEISNTAVGRAVPFATILTIDRADEETYRYTSWDSDLVIDGEVYESNAGIVPSAVASKSDMSVDNTEVSSYFDEISEIDILSGKYNNARVKAEIVDVGDLTKTPIDLFGGEIGKITATDIGFTFELRSKSHHLNQPISVKATDSCIHAFCDRKCGLNINDYTLTGYSVTEVASSNFVTRAFKCSPAPPGISDDGFDLSGSSLRNGYIEFTSGQLIGQRFDIKDTFETYSEIRLWQSLPVGLAVGDDFVIVRGCAKTPDACKGYNNFANFGGFLTGGNWFVGDDALLAGD
jgi:uncharacterized phage protein (TIGR02218 family)/uncharacterized protein (TIGR02217 family)